MARVVMREVREGEVPFDGGTAVQEEVDRPVFRGTVEVTARDDAAHTAVIAVRSKDTGGSGYANADVTFALGDGGGDINTKATINGKAASMGEGVVQSVLDALIKDFTTRLAKI